MSEIIASTYEIIEELGSGGGGTVFLANHLRLDKRVVLKADKRAISADPGLLRREVDVLKELSHPHIPNVYDFFVEDGTVYTVMDYIAGESLDKPLKRGERYSQAQVIQWAVQLLGALSYLHSPTHGDPPRGFVHSDIKPANIMRTPDNDVCLIDFNIALALGEENVIGCSAGYASPEHYGLDFSEKNDEAAAETETLEADETVTWNADETVTWNADETVLSAMDETMTMQRTLPRSPQFSSLRKKIIVPDVRSDIYSLGATLYHLLSGVRPARNAREVVPLEAGEFSPPVVKIINKAMCPNPDLRYQTADEMLYDFRHLRQKDPRTVRLRREQICAGIVLAALFSAGLAASFIGLKRMQTAENWLKLAEYSQNALNEGDLEQAVGYALQALPDEKGILVPPYCAEAQRALTEALGVYDLCDGYKAQGTVELPSAPFCMAVSPDGKTAACLYAYSAAVFDTGTGNIIAELPAAESALATAEFLDNRTILYAGKDGIAAYDFVQGTELWQGEAATAICLSGDHKSAAAVYKDEPFVTVYDTSNGEVRQVIDLGGRGQSVAVNDIFANPHDNLLALNSDGTFLAVSMADGSLELYDLADPEGVIVLYDETSGFTHFEGGFYKQYFACSASTPDKSEFAVIDVINKEQTGGFEARKPFSVRTDQEGIYVQTENLLVRIHPVTGEQTPLITTPDEITRYAVSGGQTLAASGNGYMFFDSHANLIGRRSSENECGFLCLADGTALIGSMDSPTVRIETFVDYPDELVFSYDSSYLHDEARISADQKTVMLFAYDEFRLYDMDGALIREVKLPDSGQIYDQQYRRDNGNSWLEVIYNDGRTAAYSAADGELLYEQKKEPPDPSMYEEFYTDRLRIESPLHGTPAAYDRESGALIRELEKDDYLTYVTQTDSGIITQYVTAEGYRYGQLLNDKCEVLADLPYLCDVYEDELYFDYPTGNMRKSRIYNINELKEMARKTD